MVQTRLAFFDFDGTLTSGNVVRRYAFFARSEPSRIARLRRLSRVFMRIPLWLVLDSRSRRRFNEVFFREYRGFDENWMRAQTNRLFQEEIVPSIYPSARELVDDNRREGYQPVLVSGELDIALEPVIQYFGFCAAISNALIVSGGRATGQVREPLIAEAQKVAAMRRFAEERGASLADSRAYSDSISDLPMLEAVGLPSAVNPDRRLRRVALERGWNILDLQTSRTD